MKHLNPRQGITNLRMPLTNWRNHCSKRGVKHLNPRQGITNRAFNTAYARPNKCETPKSPPGDYKKRATMYVTTASAAG